MPSAGMTAAAHSGSGLSTADYMRMLVTWMMMLFDAAVRSVLSVVPASVRSAMDRWRYRLTYLVFPMHVFVADESVHPAARLSTMHDLCHFWGFAVEEFMVETDDGYCLGVHRIRARGHQTGSRPVVLLWHGFMMNSEVWVCHPGGIQHNLALVLATQGYDVWMGNCRGNKYSHKHRCLKPSQPAFWDFSLDEHALVDLPCTVDFVLAQTGQVSLSYIGFSQGTTICFAALSLRPELRNKLNLFIALAPSTKPHGLSNSLVSSAVKATPGLLFLIFGRRSLFPSVLFYQELFSPRFLAYCIDLAVKLLFKWHGKNMSAETKAVTYQHLYSLCSVKLMVHWFQIIREGRFQMFDDQIVCRHSPSGVMESAEASDNESVGAVLYGSVVKERKAPVTPTTHLSRQPLLAMRRHSSPMRSNNVKAHVTHRFPTEQIGRSTPIALFYGGSDSLLDMKALLRGLSFPCHHPALLHWLQHPADGGAVAGAAQQHANRDAADEFPAAHTVYDRRAGGDSVLQADTINASTDSPVVMLKCVPKYEHLCFLWGDHLPQHVYPDILGLLKSHAAAAARAQQ